MSRRKLLAAVFGVASSFTAVLLLAQPQQSFSAKRIETSPGDATVATARQPVSPRELLANRPKVVVPAVLRITPGSVEAGLEQKTTSDVSSTSSTLVKLNIIESGSSGSSREVTTTNDIKQSVAANLSAGFDISKLAPTGNAGIDLNYSNGFTEHRKTVV